MNAESNPMRCWLITGAAGFIGSSLADYLLDHGQCVVGLDNFFSSKRANIDRLEFRYGSRFRFIKGDILDTNVLSLAMEGCDVVAHLAAQVSVMRSIKMPKETHDINTTGFLNVLQCADKAGAKSLVYASSCSIYGDNDKLPLVESEEPRPMNPYAASKLANEAYAAGFRILAPNLSIVGLRFFNIFGAWQDANGSYAAVIPKWIGLLKDGKQPLLFGDGSASRDFCHVQNVCEAIWRSAMAGRSVSGKVFNVASGTATRLDELYALIVRLLREKFLTYDFPEPIYQPWRNGEILHSYGSPTRSADLLDFRCEVALEEGLRRMLAEEYSVPAAVNPNSNLIKWSTKHD
jgi:UDP-N-acetylglucosamine 4-epimerase